MTAEIALAAPKPRSLLSWARAARFTLPSVILLSLVPELMLAERKYGLFGGGFGQSQALDSTLEVTAFLTVLLFAQSLLFYLLFRMVRRLHRKNADTPLFHFNFAFFVGLGAIGAAVAKYQALSYFSDAMSFQIVRNLGGGSLVDAMLYSLSEAGLALIALGAAALVYLGARWLLRRRWRHMEAYPDRSRLSGRKLIIAAVLLPVVLFLANRIDDTRSALARFNSIILVSSLLQPATDFDRDGYSLFSHPVDLQSFDGSRHPYALDIPGNGVDEDGFGGDLRLGDTGNDEAVPVIAGRKRHVILIVLESTRADALAMRFRGRPIAPTLRSIAVSGSYSDQAYSHVGFTTESLKSLFTGQLAPGDDRQSLVRDFLANGYEVGVFSGQAEDFGDTAAVTGMRRGSIFVDGGILKEERAFSFGALGSVNIDGKILLREFDRHLGRPEAWLTPRFLYFNLQSAHFPYASDAMDRILPGEPIPRGEISFANRDRVARTYWNAVAYNDRLISMLRQRLEQLDVLDDSLIVVTADHGESLFDDGFLGHGHMLNGQQTRIPFILSDPDIRLPAPIGLADMRRIILRAAGATIPQPASPGVFQYLGTLDRPGQIGLLGPDGRQTIFNLYREAVWTSVSGRWTAYSALPVGSAERAQADALIDEWARQRWLQRQRNRA